MRKRGIISTIIIVALAIFVLPLVAKEKKTKSSIYDFKVETIDGEVFKMSSLKGKKIMIVNVASRCGFTHQYDALQQLYSDYKDEGFVIIGFPANNFKNQESGDNASIKQFCTTTYGVEFPMMSKISVAGDDIAPLYKWLTSKELNGKSNYKVNWNFNKFLINRDGTIHNKLESQTDPYDKDVIKWIKK